MKRLYKLLLVLIISLIVPFFAFNDVKAVSPINQVQNGQIYYNSAQVGYYMTYTYTTNGASNEYIDLSIEGVINSDDYFKTGTWIEIRFIEHATGYIYLNYSGAITDYGVMLPTGDGVGRFTLNRNNKRMAIYFENCISLIVYNFSNVYQLTPTALVSSIDVVSYSPAISSGGGGGSVSFTDLADYQIPIESLSAYMVATNWETYTNNHDIVFEHGDVYPYFNVSSGDYSKYIKLSINDSSRTDPLHFTFACSTDLVSNIGNIGLENDNFNYRLVRTMQFSGNWSIYDFQMYGTNGSEDRIAYLNNYSIIPLYFGKADECPSSLRQYLNLSSLETVIDVQLGSVNQWLSRIYNLLNTGGSSPEDDQIISDTGDVIDDYTSAESDLFDFFDDSFSNIDLNDYSLGSSLLASVQWLNAQITEIFNQSGEFKILFVLPLVLGLALFFIGRGSVVFRQGNIDRAEFKHRMDVYNANEYADENIKAGVSTRSERNHDVNAHMVSSSRLLNRKRGK